MNANGAPSVDAPLHQLMAVLERHLNYNHNVFFRVMEHEEDGQSP